MDELMNNNQPEIISITSGKGGTGKTLITLCLGYSLIKCGHRVLMVDADPATDGLSLFILGREGIEEIRTFQSNNTFKGILNNFKKNNSIEAIPRRINRSQKDDHAIFYDAIISGKGIYGDQPSLITTAVPKLNESEFREAISLLFQSLREKKEYDYILVDTRGGFALESTDICVFSDSFVVVTEADFTSFYQDRNLIARINEAVRKDSKPILRAMIVNKALEGEEHSFRLQLETEFSIKYTDTHPIPLDIEAMICYKTHKIPYINAPASTFSFASLTAFSRILNTVTVPWKEDQIIKWNELVDSVSSSVKKRNEEISKKKEMEKLEEELLNLFRVADNG